MNKEQNDSPRDHVDSDDWMDDVARDAFECYSEACGHVTYSGKPMPTWDELDARAQSGYKAFAKSAMGALIDLTRAILDE